MVKEITITISKDNKTVAIMTVYPDEMLGDLGTFWDKVSKLILALVENGFKISIAKTC